MVVVMMMMVAVVMMIIIIVVIIMIMVIIGTQVNTQLIHWRVSEHKACQTFVWPCLVVWSVGCHLRIDVLWCVTCCHTHVACMQAMYIPWHPGWPHLTTRTDTLWRVSEHKACQTLFGPCLIVWPASCLLRIDVLWYMTCCHTHVACIHTVCIPWHPGWPHLTTRTETLQPAPNKRHKLPAHCSQRDERHRQEQSTNKHAIHHHKLLFHHLQTAIHCDD